MRRFTAIALLSTFLTGPAAEAAPAAESASASASNIRASVDNFRFDVSRYPPLVTAHPRHANGPAQKATAAFAIGFLGMLGGLVIGAMLEPSCGCDDPGVRGAMVGAPLGAVLGGILGYRLAR
jgi:hypothetical protein